MIVWTDAEAVKMARDVPDKRVEIVRTYRSKAAARRAAKRSQFLIIHDRGDVSVAEFTERPEA